MIIRIKQPRENIIFCVIHRTNLNANGPETFRKRLGRPTPRRWNKQGNQNHSRFHSADASKPIWYEEIAMFCRKQLQKDEGPTVISKELPKIVARSARERATIFGPSSIRENAKLGNLLKVDPTWVCSGFFPSMWRHCLFLSCLDSHGFPRHSWKSRTLEGFGKETY